MQSDLVIAILAGLGAMLGWGFADFFAKKTIDQIGDVTTLFWAQFLGILPLAAIFVFKPEVPQLTANSWLFLIVLGVWSGLSYIPTYVAFGKGKVSILSPIFASYAVLVSIVSAIFLGEIIPVNRIIAFIIVFIGVIMISGDIGAIWALITGRSREKREAIKGLPEILSAIFFYSILLIILDRFLQGVVYIIPFVLVIRIFSTISLFIYARLAGKKLQFANSNLWKFLIMIGLFDVGAFYLVSFGFSATPYVSIVAMLSGAFSLPTIILAKTFLKEKTTNIQTLGSILIIVGVIVLTLFNTQK